MKYLYLLLFLCSISCNQKNDNLNSYDRQMQEINLQVVDEALSQYNLATKSGDLNEIYIATSLVKEAYKQANDETKYLEWHKKEKEIERQLGLSY